MICNEDFLSKLQIYSNTVGACLDHVLLSHILEDTVIKDRVTVDHKLPVALYDQLAIRQKIVLIQYLYTLFDERAFHLNKFKNEFQEFFADSQALGDAEIVLSLYDHLGKDILMIRNNITSHSCYKIKGHEHAYESLTRVRDFDIDLIICFLRLIDVKFRIKFQSTTTFISPSEHRDALIMEEIRRKIENNSSKSLLPNEKLAKICQDVTKALVSQFYSKGIHPFYYTETGLAFLRNNKDSGFT